LALIIGERQYLDAIRIIPITISAFVLSAKANAIANFGLFRFGDFTVGKSPFGTLVRERYER
jgi:hypothetical protein